MVEPRNPRLPPWVVWLFADQNTGRIVIVQAPNVALWLFIAVSVASWALSAQGRLAVGLDVEPRPCFGERATRYFVG